jgi:ubiquitin-like 1-activating enzyme E1 A
MVVRLRGTATETIKNIVLAGVGKLVIVDDEDVSAEDLGAGFFFRDEDVGRKVNLLLFFYRQPAGLHWYASVEGGRG